MVAEPAAMLYDRVMVGYAERWRARWWMGAALWMGCSAPNPAYEGGGVSGSMESGGNTTEVVVTGSTTTSEVPEGSGGESGLASCQEAPAGEETIMRPAMGVPPQSCGSVLQGTGVLVLGAAGNYTLFRDPSCNMGVDPTPMTFLPKGPKLGVDQPHCVDYEMHYRADCSLDWGTVRYVSTGALIFFGATSAASPIQEVAAQLADPVGDVCDCARASCCAQVPSPGAYALTATAAGDTQTLAQGEQHEFTMGPGKFELQVTQARVTDACDDAVQIDWYFRDVDPA